MKALLGKQVAKLKNLWNLAISRVDLHNEKCKDGCHDRRDLSIEDQGDIGPYEPCQMAVKLASDEDAARKAYLDAGGRLPTI